MWESLSNFFGGSSGDRDVGLEALINANDLANAQYGNDYTQYQTFGDLPSYYDQYYNQPTDSSSMFGGMGFKDLAALGLGGLSLYSNWKATQDANDLKRDELGVVQEDKRLKSADDFAKMHALSQIIQARQGINLDPSLAYAEAMRREMGLSPEGSADFAGVDIGGPMKTGMSSQDRLSLINEAAGLQMADGGMASGGGGLSRMLMSRNPQLMAAMQQRDQRQQQADGGGMPSFLARRLAPQREARQLQQQRFQQEQMQPRQFGGLSAIMARNPQILAALQQQQGMQQPYQLAGGGNVQGLLAGGSGGQDDKIDAQLSHGEYVFDADTVASLGDGNTEAGAAKLDHMREAIRQHKRSAPADKIPPPSKGALAYLADSKKGK